MRVILVVVAVFAVLAAAQGTKPVTAKKPALSIKPTIVKKPTVKPALLKKVTGAAVKPKTGAGVPTPTTSAAPPLPQAQAPGGCVVVTASTAVNSHITDNCGGLMCAAYLVPASCLGVAGPISAMGPLGILGPIGSNAWNPSAWMGAMGDWSSWSAQISSKTAAPLSSAGPLGAYGTLANSPNGFMRQLQAGGVFGVLGPIGPLGATGPLGPLGPMGVHGFARNQQGQYTHGSQVQRTVSYPWDVKGTRTWELYEHYPSLSAAKAVAGQDTSFMYESNILVNLDLSRNTDEIAFTSASEQFVTIVAVPERMSDAFKITLKDSAGVVATSAESLYINWIQVKASAGQKFTVATTLGATSMPSPIGFNYRLYVTGSSNLVNHAGVTGQQIHSCK